MYYSSKIDVYIQFKILINLVTISWHLRFRVVDYFSSITTSSNGPVD